MTTAMTLAGGNLYFLAFIVIAFAGLVIGYFTVKGSGITPRSYGKVYGGAPAAKHGGDASGRDHSVRISDWSRGTK